MDFEKTESHTRGKTVHVLQHPRATNRFNKVKLTKRKLMRHLTFDFDRLCQNIKLINLVSPFININRYMPAWIESFNTLKLSLHFI